jgi:hypothetical protein
VRRPASRGAARARATAAVRALYLVVQTRRVLTWMVIATFFAVALYPLTA